jgi:hypothetical protein
VIIAGEFTAEERDTLRALPARRSQAIKSQ